MEIAFVLGAGLGTRLKSLTSLVPKPLIPVHQKPLITCAFDHLISSGINRFIVNTHHRADAYDVLFPDKRYRGAPITFRHEPDILETAGGIANIADLTARDPFIVYNGDILTDLPLALAIEDHHNRGNLVTLVLRTTGPSLHIARDDATGNVIDIRNRLETGAPCRYQFTGIYLVSPDFVALLEPGKKQSVIPVFLDVIRQGRGIGIGIGGVVIDGGSWWDLGDRDAYLDASAALSAGDFPIYGRNPLQARIHHTATIHPEASVCPRSSVGEAAVIEAGARVEESILWPGARVAAGASLRRCIVGRNAIASGQWSDADI